MDGLLIVAALNNWTVLLAAALGALFGCGSLFILLSRNGQTPLDFSPQQSATGKQKWVPPPSSVTFRRITTAPMLVAAIGCATAACIVLLSVTAIPALGIAAAACGAVFPAWLVVARTRRNKNRLAVVWADAIDLITSGIRAGMPLPEAMAELGRVGPGSSRLAFGTFERQYQLTGSFDLALDTLANELDDPVADRLIETIRLARNVGGTQLIPVLHALGSGIRREQEARAEALAKRSWIVMVARMGLAAPWIVVLVLATRPEAASAYRTPDGTLLVLGALAVGAVAYPLMLRVGRLPQVKRWLR